MTDRKFIVLGAQVAEAAMSKGTVEQVKLLSDLAHQAYFGGSGSFNAVTVAFIQLLKQLGAAIPEDLEHYQRVILYSSAQNAILGYREQARDYEALKRTADRVKHGELAGAADECKVEYAESQLSKQAKKLLAM
jgi:hypothetical protein